MGPEGSSVPSSDVYDKMTPSFGESTGYPSYREDVLLWTNLTSLTAVKRGPGLVGRQNGEVKSSAKYIYINNICTQNGVEQLLERLDKYYVVDSAKQLDSYFAKFLYYTWKKSTSIEQYITGFNSRLEKISTLNLNNKLKGHLLLHQAILPSHEKYAHWSLQPQLRCIMPHG